MSIFTAAVVADVDLVDQAELVDVGRNFRIVDGLQAGDDVVGEPVELVLRQRGGAADGGVLRRLFRGGILGDRRIVGHAKNSCALISEAASDVHLVLGVVHAQTKPGRWR